MHIMLMSLTRGMRSDSMMISGMDGNKSRNPLASSCTHHGIRPLQLWKDTMSSVFHFSWHEYSSTMHTSSMLTGYSENETSKLMQNEASMTIGIPTINPISIKQHYREMKRIDYERTLFEKNVFHLLQ